MIFINPKAYEEYVKSVDTLLSLPHKFSGKMEQAKKNSLSDNDILEKDKEKSLTSIKEKKKFAESEYENIKEELASVAISIHPRKRPSGNEKCKDMDSYIKEQSDLALMIRKQVHAMIKKENEQAKERETAANELAERSKRLKEERELKNRQLMEERELEEKRRKYWEEKAREEEEKARERARQEEKEKQEQLLRLKREKMIRTAIIVILIIMLCIVIGQFL